MQHRLKVRGAIPRKSIPCVCGVEVENETDGITFTAASEEDMKRLKHLLAFELADMITQEYEEQSLSAYIEAAHPYFLPGERQKILHSARLAVQKTPPAQRAHYIENRLYSFLADSERLSLEGFVNFRLKEYRTLLKKAATAAVDVYLAQREYEEFITLLKLFVNTQDPRETALHVVAQPDGSYYLLNAEGEKLHPMFEETFGAGSAYALTEDDRLLSTLITLSPEEITFHQIENLQNARLLETVMKVFSGRVHVCEMCTICKNEKEF